MAAPGDHDATSRPRMEVDASTSHGRRNHGRSPPRDGGASRPVRETHAEHHWWDWYAAYMNARESGSTPEQASAAAERYMAEVKHVVARKSGVTQKDCAATQYS